MPEVILEIEKARRVSIIFQLYKKMVRSTLLIFCLGGPFGLGASEVLQEKHALRLFHWPGFMKQKGQKARDLRNGSCVRLGTIRFHVPALNIYPA